jgi:hypothetical protein
METLQIISRMIIGAVLICACVAKLANFRWFVGVVAAYRLWWPKLNVAAATILIALELSIGGTLLLIGNSWCGWVAMVLFALFGAMTAINLARKRFDVKCGCFGPRSSRISWSLLLRNLSLAGVAWLSTGTATRVLMKFSWPLFVGLLGLTLFPFSKLQRKSRLKEA